MHILCDTVLWGCRWVVDIDMRVHYTASLPPLLQVLLKAANSCASLLVPGLLHGDARQFTCNTCWRMLPPHRTDMCNRNPNLGWTGVCVWGGVCACESATRLTWARIKEQHMFTAAEQHMGFHSYDQRARREGTNLSKDKVERRLKQLEAIKQPDKKNPATVIQEFCHRLMWGEIK